MDMVTLMGIIIMAVTIMEDMAIRISQRGIILKINVSRAVRGSMFQV